jgi:hypothetical protein
VGSGKAEGFGAREGAPSLFTTINFCGWIIFSEVDLEEKKYGMVFIQSDIE